MSINPEAKSAPTLTQEDVRNLLQESIPETRAAVAAKIAANHASGHFKENELIVAEQIFRLLLRDTESRVRASLAEGLKSDPKAPHDVMLKLAQDKDEDVSLPVLQHSDVFNDEDLLDIVRSNSEITKHIAIANRKSVSSMVSAALVETQNESVVGHLVKNSGANISEHSMHKIIEDHGASQEVVSYVVQRANLPVTVVENLLTIVSDSVASRLKSQYKEVAERVEREAARAREGMTLKLLDTTRDEEAVLALVQQLFESDRLTPSIILTSLCRGNFNFFEASLARMAGIPLPNARKLIRDKGDLGFRSLYQKAGLPDSMFDACRLVLTVMHEISEQGGENSAGTIHFANKVVEKVLQRQQGREIDNLAYIIALIRQNVR